MRLTVFPLFTPKHRQRAQKPRLQAGGYGTQAGADEVVLLFDALLARSEADFLSVWCSLSVHEFSYEFLNINCNPY